MIRRLAVVLLSLLPACSAPPPGRDGGPAATTTVSPITDIVARIGQGRATVTGIVPEGTNSHTFEPAPVHARLLSEADVVFVNGLHLEAPTIALARANVADGTPIVRLAERTISSEDYIYDFSFPRFGGVPNPHLWTNPPYARRYAEIVAKTLIRLDPEGRPRYRANLRAFAADVDALDDALRTATATIPPERRKLLTYHDSFAYFAREYGWEVIGAIQPSDFSEPTPREVADLIDQIEAADVPAVFGSEVFTSPVLEHIASSTGARYVADLRDDDLPGRPGNPAHSYMGLMLFDYRSIVRALGGDTSALDDLAAELRS